MLNAASVATKNGNVIMRPSAPATILIVEEEPQLLQLIGLILQKAGYQVLAARTEVEADRLLREHGTFIGLVVMDIPEASNHVPGARLCGASPDLKVIYISEEGRTGNLKPDAGPRVVRFLAKPFNPELLKRMVRELLEVPCV